jgi:serine/threonine protein kinase
MALKFLTRTFPAVPNYEILEKIQEGGMSSVYKGRHQESGQLVAIKIFKAKKIAADPTLLQRFEQEFQACKKLLHPNIVQALEFRRVDSAILVMEFVDGQTLGDLVKREGRLPEKEAICLITQVALALEFAHQMSMIHRDVKPDNILVKPNGQVKLTDFGLVKDFANDQKLTGPLTVLGTPHFMAPEQYTEAQNADARCDVYSLAATLYWTVTGRLPFDAGEPLEVIKKQAANELIPPRQLVPDLSEHLDAAIRTAMSPARAGRPPTCMAFVQGLTERKSYRLSTAARPGNSKTGGGAAEQRTTVRLPCTIGTSCKTNPSILEEGNTGEDSWPATIQDVSLGGVGLLISRRFEPGTMLRVTIQEGSEGPVHSLPAKVVRIVPEEFGHWLTGCVWERPLLPGELQDLL